MYRILDAAAFVPIALMTTLFPIISAAYPLDMARVRRIVQLAIDYLGMVSLPVLAFSLVASLPLVHALFGGAFDRGADALPVLMGAYVVICFGYISGNLVITTDLQRRYVAYAIVGLIVNVVLNLIFIPRYGYLAAAWMTLLTNIVVVAPAMRSVLKRVDLRPSARRLLRVAAAATISGGAVGLSRHAGVSLAGLVAVMVVTYPAALLALGALDTAELRGVLSRRAV
jgi:O-antigen/teichoic acid export membrane protein